MTFDEAFAAVPTESWKAVRDFLIARGVTGYRKMACDCPLSSYFHHETGINVLTKYYGIFRIGEPLPIVQMTQAMSDFVMRFDHPKNAARDGMRPLVRVD